MSRNVRIVKGHQSDFGGVRDDEDDHDDDTCDDEADHDDDTSDNEDGHDDDIQQL